MEGRGVGGSIGNSRPIVRKYMSPSLLLDRQILKKEKTPPKKVARKSAAPRCELIAES